MRRTRRRAQYDSLRCTLHWSGPLARIAISKDIQRANKQQYEQLVRHLAPDYTAHKRCRLSSRVSAFEQRADSLVFETDAIFDRINVAPHSFASIRRGSPEKMLVFRAAPDTTLRPTLDTVAVWRFWHVYRRINRCVTASFIATHSMLRRASRWNQLVRQI